MSKYIWLGVYVGALALAVVCQIWFTTWFLGTSAWILFKLLLCLAVSSLPFALIAAWAISRYNALLVQELQEALDNMEQVS